MSTLISRQRALDHLNQLSVSAPEIALLDSILLVASQAIERHCGRSFGLEERDELHDGALSPILRLRHYPVVAIQRVAFGPRTVLQIRNDDPANARALVWVSDTGLTLVRVAAGATTSNAISFEDAPTVTDLVEAIVALAAGWSVAAADEDLGRATADLGVFPGSFSAKDAPASLAMHVRERSAYLVDAPRGFLISDEGWSYGPRHWRIVYTSGSPAIPEDIQEACAEWCAALFWQTKRDPGSIERAIMPASVRRLLASYRDWKI